MISKFVRFLGSVRLAVPLLGTIALILIGATVYESNVGSATVQNLIYKSPWFGALMFLLAMNLGVSTASRYPWRGSRKIGFALTHMGLIVIIAGSAAVIHLSTEGMLLVRTDGGPNNEVRIEGDVLEVIAPDQRQQQAELFIKPDGSVVPKQLGELSILGYSDRTLKNLTFSDDGQVDNLAVHLQLSSDRMGQTLDRWLAIAPVAYQALDIGPARLELVSASDDQALDALLSPDTQSPGELGSLQLSVDHQSLDLDVKQALNTTTKLKSGIKVRVQNVWPDFRMTGDNQPETVSQQFRNPAVQLLVSQGDRQERWFVFSNPAFEPIRSGGSNLNIQAQYQAPVSNPSDYFRVVVSPDQMLYYAARSSKGFMSGELKPGDVIEPGWADFKINLTQVFHQAQIQRAVVPVTPVASGLPVSQGAPALHVATPSGDDVWIPWGEPTAISRADGTYFTAFSPKRVVLPFTVELNEFIVERNEGSESVAMWTSDLTLRDTQTEQVRRQRVWMNHPTWFKGWKLAQASWNPGDLQQSTLQLKREPWWVTALTWIGSLLVVTGIGTMFYGRAIAKTLKRSKSVISPEAKSVVEPVTELVTEPVTEPVAENSPTASESPYPNESRSSSLHETATSGLAIARK